MFVPLIVGSSLSKVVKSNYEIIYQIIMVKASGGGGRDIFF